MGNWCYFTSISAVYSLQLGKKAYFERFVLRIPPEELELPVFQANARKPCLGAVAPLC